MAKVVTGFDELAKEFRRLPKEAAARLQAAVVANHLDHRKEIIASSKMSPEGKRLMKFAIRVFPGGGGRQRRRTIPSKVQDVTGETASFWKGSEVDDPAEGAAARIERQIGESTLRPKRRRLLLIPQGDFVTPTGRPRRKRRGGRTVTFDPRTDLKGDTFVVKTRSGELILVEELERGAAGQFERQAARQRGAPLGRASGLGVRTRVVGILKRQAKGFRGLDFFGSWNRLQTKRTNRYDRLLDDLVRKR